MQYFKLEDNRYKNAEQADYTHVMITREDLAAFQAACRERDNLLRINLERANADRDLRPKKQHTGYVFLQSVDPRDSNKWYTTSLQTPYSLAFSREDVMAKVKADLNGDIGLKIGLDRELTPEEIRELGVMASVTRNQPSKLMLRANGRNGGFWEVIFQHRKSINTVPSDMLP